LNTIIAVTTGEEEYTDSNSNGSYDVGEPFVDLSSPFIDRNDDGVFQSNEWFGTYFDANGQWDGSTQIWVPTWMTFTGHLPEPTVALASCPGPTEFLPAFICPDGVSIPKQGFADLFWFVSDANLNPLNETLDVTATLIGKIKITASSPVLPFSPLDHKGVDIEWVEYGDATHTTSCPVGQEICYRGPMIYGYAIGSSGVVTLQNIAPDADAQSPATLDIKATYKESPQGTVDTLTSHLIANINLLDPVRLRFSWAFNNGGSTTLDCAAVDVDDVDVTLTSSGVPVIERTDSCTDLEDELIQHNTGSFGLTLEGKCSDGFTIGYTFSTTLNAASYGINDFGQFVLQPVGTGCPLL
jgi:hypothetical protein